MSIYLGNLSTKDIQRRLGCDFPPEVVAYLDERQQDKAENIKPGKWHCFDIPFVLVCGDMETAVEVNKRLSPLAGPFKGQLEIGIYDKGENDE